MSDINAETHIVLNQAFADSLQSTHPTQLANANVFALLLPTLYGCSDKKKQPLQKVDHYMLQETEELYLRLRRFCRHLDINPQTAFKVTRRGDRLAVIGNFNGREALNQLLNQDHWFVDSFLWLQPNYASLAHSFEMLEFSLCYEQSPWIARQKYAHFDSADKGLAFALSYAHGAVNAQIESPVNVYCV